ncbi:MAG: response regulator [Candidatus Margulisiibacteriota bacterium]|nr:response regulator [Candidatus Margulisiibacteriota bacterium]
MGNKKILVADNNIQSLQTPLKKLRENNYDIVTAYDGIQVVKLSHAHSPSLVILSVNMPGGGLAIFENLKFSVETSVIPVILLTEKIDTDARQELIEKGAREVIVKPIESNELLSVVNKIIGSDKKAKPSSPVAKEGFPTETPVKAPLETAIPAKGIEETEMYKEDIKTLYEEIKSKESAKPAESAKKIKRDQKMVLVVDDEPDVNSLLALLLKSQGYQVISAVDGQQGLEMARKENPDLILLDIMLPKLDGYKIARMLKFDEQFRHIPIIMLTAKIQDKDRDTGLEMGANEYITKPFDTKIVLAKIKEMLAKEE